MSAKKIIFHSVVDIHSDGNSGDKLRPRKMYEAFLELGYEVILCHGESKDRRCAIKKILKSDLSEIHGLYSELSSKSLYFSDADNIPRSLFLDFCFFRKLRVQGIPISFFYRDIHWLYEGETSAPKSFLKRLINRTFHTLELFQLKRFASIFFVPSVAMSHKIPRFLRPTNVAALPPGCEISAKEGRTIEKGKGLNLFYVGGCTPPLYDLSLIFQAVDGLKSCTLTLCVRETEWATSRYNIPDNVRVVHLSGTNMLKEMSSSDALIMAYPQSDYRDFAVPVKLYEAMGCGLPVIVSNHGETAEIVRRERTGWVVKDLGQLQELLVRLLADSGILEQMRDNVWKAAEENRWLDRARFVCNALKPHK